MEKNLRFLMIQIDADVFCKSKCRSTRAFARDGGQKGKVVYAEPCTGGNILVKHCKRFIRDAKPRKPAINPGHIRP